MKIKIFIITLIVLQQMNYSIKAQEYKVPAENSKDVILNLEGFTGNLNIEGYSGNEIIFSAPGSQIEVPDRAKGLKPIYPGGTDNSGLGLSVEKNGNLIDATCILPFTKKREFTVKVPENISIKVKSECQNSSDIFINNMKNEIEIQTCHDIDLKNVSGPLVLSTIAGDINIIFSSLSNNNPISINSISGDIDITLPDKTAADVDLQTVTGTMYSDFDFSENSKDMKRVGGNQVSCKLNGGGPKYSIVTVSSNIYLRKGK